MTMDLKEKLKKDYAVEEDKIKRLARGTLSSFLGIDVESVSDSGADPNEKGVRIYLRAGEFDFVYSHPSGKIEFSMDGNLYDVVQRSDIGRIITFKENKLKQ
jgi:hypothetical protein